MDNVQPGQSIGPYQILNQVGQGGMATVYRAFHSAMDRYVAIKILPRKLAESPEFTGRFRQEARTIARLEHSHILPVHDYGESDGYTYLVMRYLEAGTLKERLQQETLSLREVDRLFTQLADALDYAHALGVIHRDLKPSNVLLDARNNVFLTDFGIAKLLQGDANFTSTGAMIGTPAYMSPEQAQGLPVDRRSDIYSLGIILYEMVTGQVPFEADTPLAVILKQLNEPLPLPSRVKPGLPLSIEKVLLKVLAKDPSERYDTTAEFVEGWKAAIQEATGYRTGTVAVPPGTPAPTSAIPAQPPPAKPPVRPPESVAPPRPGVPPGAPAPAQPASRRRALLGPLGLVAALGLLLCAGSLCAVFVFRDRLFPGLLSTQVASGTQGSDPTAQATSLLGTVFAPVDTAVPEGETPEPEPTPSGTWESWTAVNTIYSTLFLNGKLLTGGPGGMTGWDPASGEVTDRFTTLEGLPGVYVTSLMVTDDGTFYIATDNGLLEYVNDQVLLHNIETGLDSHHVSALLMTDQGLVVGTSYSGRDGGGLQVRVGENEWESVPDFPSSDSDDPELLSNEVTALVLDAAGNLWVGTSHGLGFYDGSSWTIYGPDEGLSDPYITTLTVVDGTLLVGTGAGLVYYDGSGFVAIPEAEFSPVYGVVLGADGSLWVSGGGGVARRNPDGDWTTWGYLDLPGYNIYSGVEGDDGRVYFGTDVGVLNFAGDDYTLWTAPNVPANAAFGAVRRQPDTSLLWFIQEYGSRIDLYDLDQGQWMPGPDLDCPSSCVPMYWDEAGRLWVADDEGVYVFEGDSLVETITTEQGLPEEPRIAIQGSEGTVWVGTLGGLALLENGSVTTVYDTSNSGLTYDEVYGLLLASDNSLWVATEGNLSRLLPDGEWVTYTEGDPFGFELRVSGLVEDTNGNIWASTLGDGIFRYSLADDAWTRYSPEDAGVDLVTNEFISIAAGPEGTVWAGVYFGGAAFFDGENWHTYDTSLGIIHSNVNAIYVEESGAVWFATSGGVTRYTP